MNENNQVIPHSILTNLELEIMCRIASGIPISQISEQLSLPPKTISAYRLRILKKMNLKTNNEIIRYSVINSLIE